MSASSGSFLPQQHHNRCISTMTRAVNVTVYHPWESCVAQAYSPVVHVSPQFFHTVSSGNLIWPRTTHRDARTWRRSSDVTISQGFPKLGKWVRNTGSRRLYTCLSAPRRISNAVCLQEAVLTKSVPTVPGRVAHSSCVRGSPSKAFRFPEIMAGETPSVHGYHSTASLRFPALRRSSHSMDDSLTYSSSTSPHDEDHERSPVSPVVANELATEFMRYYRRAMDEYYSIHTLLLLLTHHDNYPSISSHACCYFTVLYPGNPTAVALQRSYREDVVVTEEKLEGADVDANLLRSSYATSSQDPQRQPVTRSTVIPTVQRDRRFPDTRVVDRSAERGKSIDGRPGSSPYTEVVTGCWTDQGSSSPAHECPNHDVDPGTRRGQGYAPPNAVENEPHRRDTQSEPDIVSVFSDDIRCRGNETPREWDARYTHCPELTLLALKQAVKRSASEGNVVVDSFWAPEDENLGIQRFRTVPSQLSRPSRFDILRAMWIDVATNTIQRFWRGYRGRVKAANERHFRLWLQFASQNAMKIQRAVRRYMAIFHAKQELFALQSQKIRLESAIRIQAFWKQYQRQWKRQQEVLMLTLLRVRASAATAIQRFYRGYKTRQFLDLKASHWVVCWTWDSSGKVVELVGSFTKPMWTKRILMAWHPTMQCYFVVLPRVVGRYEFKFSVNGQYCCDGTLAVISDGATHYNNVIELGPGFKVPPLKVLRERLASKIKILSTCTDADDSARIPLRYTGSAARYQSKEKRQLSPRSSSLRATSPSRTSVSSSNGSESDSDESGASEPASTYSRCSAPPEKPESRESLPDKLSEACNQETRGGA